MRLCGGLVVPCFRFFVFTVAPKALPCVGYYYPLHHFGTFLRRSALPHWGIHHWCSRSPFGRPLRHLSTRSGPWVPVLLLSAAASRLPVSLLCVWCPCVRVWFCPLCSALSPPLSTSLSFRVMCVPSRVLSVSGRLSCVLSRSVGAPVRCLRVEFVFSLFGATQSPWSLAVSSPRFAVALAVLALVVSRFLVVCWWAPFFWVVLLGLVRGSRTRFGAMDWTALQWVSLALTSGTPCLAVQSAREQQSLHTWFVQYWCSVRI